MATGKTDDENGVLKESCSEINNTNRKELLNTKIQKIGTAKHVGSRRSRKCKGKSSSQNKMNISNPLYDLADYNSILGGRYPNIQEYRLGLPILNNWQSCSGDRCHPSLMTMYNQPYNNQVEMLVNDKKQNPFKIHNATDYKIPVRRPDLGLHNSAPYIKKSDCEENKDDVRKNNNSKLTIATVPNSSDSIVPNRQYSNLNNANFQTITYNDREKSPTLTHPLRTNSFCENSTLEKFHIDLCAKNENMKHVKSNENTFLDDGGKRIDRNEKPNRRSRSRSESGEIGLGLLPQRNSPFKNEADNNDSDLEPECDYTSPKIIIDQKIIDASTESILNEYRILSRIDEFRISSGGAGDAFKCLADEDYLNQFKIDTSEYHVCSGDRTTSPNNNIQNTEKLNHKYFVLPGQGDVFKLHCYNNYYDQFNTNVYPTETFPTLHKYKIKSDSSNERVHFCGSEPFQCNVNTNWNVITNPSLHYARNNWEDAPTVFETARGFNEVKMPYFYNICEGNNVSNSLYPISRNNLKFISSTNKVNCTGQKPQKLSLLSSEKLKRGNFINSPLNPIHMQSQQSRFALQLERQCFSTYTQSLYSLPPELLENFASMNLHERKSGHVSKKGSKTPRPFRQAFPNGFSNSESTTNTNSSPTNLERNSNLQYSRTPPAGNTRKQSHKRKPDSVRPRYTQFV